MIKPTPDINPEVRRQYKAELFLESQQKLSELLDMSMEDTDTLEEDGKEYVSNLCESINLLHMAKKKWEKGK